MIEGQKRLGVAGAIGLAAAVVAGCNSGPDVASFNYKISFRSEDGQRLNCVMNGVKEEPRDESAIILVDVFCPKEEQVREVLESTQTRYEELYIDFDTSPAFEIGKNRPDAPPL